MTAKTTSRGTDKLKKSTSPLGRAQLEQALARALDEGPNALPQQLLYVLAISQMQNAEPDNSPLPQKPLNASRARIIALSRLADALTTEQIAELVQNASTLPDPAERAQLIAQLALRLPADDYKAVVRDIWQQVNEATEPIIRARALFAIAPLLTLVHDEPATPVALLDVLGQAQTIRNAETRLRSLAALVPYLPSNIAVRTFNRILHEISLLRDDAQKSNILMSIADKLPSDMEQQALSTAQAIADPAERARALTALANDMPDAFRSLLRADALDAIASIEREEERAAALIAFAPHLEYASANAQFPALLEKALSIVIALSRRHIRVQVLVTLAPHLTLDLQGEALAAVHRLPDERQRAQLLAELAPTLPPEMLVASLAVAHTMRQQDARVKALSALAHYVPDNARTQTLLDAFAAASNLSHHYERVTALVGLMDILPDNLRDQALQLALNAIESIDNENARSRALNQLGPYLTSALLPQALNLAYQLSDPQGRLNAYLGLVPRLTGDQRTSVMSDLFNWVQKIPLEYKRARALVSIIPYLSPNLLDETRQLVDSFSDAFDRVLVYIALVQNMPHAKRPLVMAKAWMHLKQIEDGYDRASCIVALAPYLPTAARRDVALAAANAIRLIADDYDKASAITILAPLLGEDIQHDVSLPDSFRALRLGFQSALDISSQSLRAQLLAQGVALCLGNHDREQIYTLWSDAMRRIKNLPLADALICIGQLVPLARELLGVEMLSEFATLLGVR